MFTDKDLKQITSHSLELATVQTQVENFKRGFPYLTIERAAVVGDGILKNTPEEVERMAQYFMARDKSLKVLKFVPASGAATRMFKAMFEFLGSGERNKSVDKVVENIEKFAFYDDISSKVGDDTQLISAIVSEEGLNYGNMPKALIKFHKYADSARTAAEEHLLEGAMYAASGDDVYIHFTVSPEHLSGFESLFSGVLATYEAKLGVKFHISFSSQKNSTDMIAVDLSNEPFREDDGSLLFRPAGHGALLSNLDDIDADLIFIKTVDNVAPDRLKADTVLYKKYLAGLTMSLQTEVFDLLKRIDAGEDVRAQAQAFISEKLCYELGADYASLSSEAKQAKIKEILNRPLRVCGMVKNEGEPGGGPFWVKDSQGALSLQIAESSQISPEQISLMKEATHFNPVDLVCAVRDYKGEKFALQTYVDPSTGFISEKSKNGRELKAQELPGLWNGAMARWNTIFAEVPISSFSPVKELSDLLRDVHQ